MEDFEIKLFQEDDSVMEDEDDKFLSSLKPEELNYIEMKLSNPSFNNKALAVICGVSPQQISKYAKNTAINGYINKKMQERIKVYLSSQSVVAEKISEYAANEILKRFEDTKTDRKTAEDLLSQGYTHHEAKLILGTRVEGMTVNQLSTVFTELPKMVSKLQVEQEEADELEMEVINGISDRYTKYKYKSRNIDLSKYNPENKIEIQTFSSGPAKKSKEDEEVDFDIDSEE